MLYDEIEYWNKRENPNAKNPDTEKHIKYVKENLKGCKNILDFGCGVGRIFPAYEKIDTVEGYDISSNYKSIIIEKSNEFDFKLNLTINKKIEDLPYNNNEFDASVAVSILLHQRPKNILKIMSELYRVSKKVIIISWFDPVLKFNDHNKNIDSKNYCYHYNYYEICKEFNWNIKNIITKDRLIYFCMVKE